MGNANPLIRHRQVLLIALVTLLMRIEPMHAQDLSKIEIVPSLGHSSLVSSVVFSPDGARVLSGSDDNTIKLWDTATGTLIRTFEGHAGQVQSVAFSPDGTRVLSGSWDNSLKLWDAATGALIRTFGGHSRGVTSVAFSHDGRRVLSGSSDLTIKLWDPVTGVLIRTFFGHSDWISSVALSPEGDRLVSGSGDKTVKLWDAATGALIRTLEGHWNGVTSVTFSPDGSRVLSGSWDKTIRLWDAATGALLRKFDGHSDLVHSVAFSPDGTRVLSGSSDRTIRLWDAATGELIRTFNGHSWLVSSVAFSPDGTRVLSGSWDKTIRVWDAATGALYRTFEGHPAAISSVAFSPDGTRVLSGCNDTTIKLWDAATGALIRSFEGHSNGVTSVTFSPDGTRVLSGSNDNTIKLWDAVTGALIRTFEGHSDHVDSVAFSPDGTRVLSGSADRTIKLWDAATGALMRTFEGHSNRVTSVGFSPDGARVLSGGWDNNIKLWDAAPIGISVILKRLFTGALIRTFKGWVTSVTFSPDGTRVLSGSGDIFGMDKTIKLWDAATGTLIRTFEGHSGGVSSVAFSPDGTRVLSGSLDNTLKLWDMPTGSLIRTFVGHTYRVTSVAFSPDGSRALSGSLDGTTRIWNLTTGERLVTLVGGRGREWLTITPAGFFAESGEGADAMLSVVRGVDVTTIGQVHQSLFNPDLIRASLAGDPQGEVRRAGDVINLDKVLESGPAPLVEITTHHNRSETEIVTLVARIKDQGKGIGRIEWRMNGITVGVTNAPTGAGPVYDVKRELALDPGENVIEVVAYNERNLLASLPARTTIVYVGPADKHKPDIYILAIGINKYVDRGTVVPGPNEGTYFPELTYAVADATAFAEEMKQAGEGFYGKVRVRTALDEQAAGAALDRMVRDIGAEIQPRDTFVLFAAAHGYSNKENGRFYLIPQDYQGGTDPAALARGAVGQEQLQDWVANQVRAKKAIILLDTCRSGALTAGYTRSRIDERPSEAAVGRLHEATGRPVLTAAATGEDAQELQKLGHGVFTTALIDALHHGDSNGDGLIEVSELAAHVEKLVPELAGGGQVRAAVARRGSDADIGLQSAHFGSTGGDFPLANRLP